MANLGLERALAAEGLPLVRVPWAIAMSWRKCCAAAAIWAGSNRGTSSFLDDATTGDGLLTALKITCIVALRGPLDDLVHGLNVFPQTIINIRVRSKPPLESLPGVSLACLPKRQQPWRSLAELFCGIPGPSRRRVSWSRQSANKTWHAGRMPWQTRSARPSGPDPPALQKEAFSRLPELPRYSKFCRAKPLSCEIT